MKGLKCWYTIDICIHTSCSWPVHMFQWWAHSRVVVFHTLYRGQIYTKPPYVYLCHLPGPCQVYNCFLPPPHPQPLPWCSLCIVAQVHNWLRDISWFIPPSPQTPPPPFLLLTRCTPIFCAAVSVVTSLSTVALPDPGTPLVTFPCRGRPLRFLYQKAASTGPRL